jgi:hypothetical protein
MAHACMAAINTCAASSALQAPEGSNIGAKRALALASMITGFDATGGGATGGGATGGGAIQPRVGAHLEVTISAASLFGYSEEPAEFRAGKSTVPILAPACAIRELVALSGADPLTWRRLVVDPVTGHLLDRGRDAYQVGKRLRDWITARDRTCRFPGCERRAARCEVDHAVPFDSGGPTVRSNLGALCKRHHLLKTHAGWSIENSAEDGSCIWVSPMDLRYVHQPVALLVPHAPGPVPHHNYRAGHPPGPSP